MTNRVIPDIDIYRTASVLIDSHGDGALLEAMYRIEQYRRIGNRHGMAVWGRIADAVETLQIPPDLATQTLH
jgi:hypothetical protein